MCSAWTSRPPVGGEQGGRAVGPFLDVGGKGRPPQHRPHLLGHAGQLRDEDLQLGRVKPVRGWSSRLSGDQPRASPTDPAPSSRRGPRWCSPARRSPPGPGVHTRRGCPGSGRSASWTGDGRRARGPQRDHLDRRPRPGEPVAPAVLGLEVGRRGDGQLVALPGVAAVQGGLDRRAPSARRRPSRAAASAASSARRLCRRPSWSAGSGQLRTRSAWRGAASRPAADSTPARGGTTTAGMPRASARAQACSGPAPPNATRARPCRVDAALDRHPAQGPDHGGVDHVDDARRRRRRPGRGPAGRRRRPAGRARAGAPSAGMRPATRSASVTVGCSPAPAVAGRAGLGPGALRARRPARRRGRCGRSTRRRRRWCGRRAAGMRIGKPATVRCAGRLGPAVPDQAHVGAGAAHVEGDRVGETGGHGGGRPGQHPARRPGQQQGHRALGRLVERDEAAGRGHAPAPRRPARPGASR